jgi:hemerythrin-like domain-containing protein
MKYNGIAYLMAEHDVISQVEHLIARLDGQWHRNNEAYETAVNQLISFFREYGDKLHHYKEEQVLFPLLMSKSEFSQPSLVDELEDHHELFREYMSTIETALRKANYEKVQETLVKYSGDLLDHIAAENDELFVMAESLMSEDELEAMYFNFIDFDAQVGNEVKRQLAEIPNTVERLITR